MRTIVLSDCHGHPQLVTAALEDAGFVNGRDRLVFAGDFLDRGPLPAACLEVLEEAGAEMLLGNHDAAILLGQQIWPQDGVIMFRHAMLLAGGAALNTRQCEAALTSAVAACERYYQAFQFVIWAGRNAREALDAALFETAGEA